MQDLQFSLIVLGGFAILGVLVHGLWTIRNNKEQKASSEQEDIAELNTPSPLEKADEPIEPDFSDYVDPVDNQPVEQDYDELGIGQVRVVDVEPKKPEPVLGDVEGAGFSAIADEEEMPEPPMSLMKGISPESEAPAATNVVAVSDAAEPEKRSLNKPKVEMYPSPVTHNKADSQNVEPKMSATEPGVSEPKTTEPKVTEPKIAEPRVAEQNHERREPRINEEQMSIEFDDEIRLVADEETPAVQNSTPAQPLQQEVLVLNVRTPDDKPIPGAALLPMLLTLGFKFGDQDIFHRHVNSNGKGPVLFSLANMFKPGNFDIDNLENFTTQGISLFMMLPIDGDPHQVFNMMHNAARKIADEFGAQVLDGRRSLLTRQSLQQYVEKIREFERQRMLRK